MLTNPLLRKLCKTVLFIGCLVFFLDRGPYRAIRYSTTGDFSTVYAASRCWLHGANPYDRKALKAELTKAGAPPDLQKDQDVNPSVYLPSALLWTAIVAWMPWSPANVVWCVVSVLFFALSLAAILKATVLESPARWYLACAGLLFSPTYVGVYDGNPSVLVIALVAIAICWGSRTPSLLPGFPLGMALCFKPQIAICAFCIFFLWKRWGAISLALGLFVSSVLVGVLITSHFGQEWQWWNSEQQNTAVSFEAGGQSDPSPGSPVAWQLLNAQTLVSYVLSDRQTYNVAVWSIAGCLVGIFFQQRLRHSALSPWRDVAFFAAWTLIVTYHRYYDAQILLLALPLLLELWRSRRQMTAGLLSACLLLLAFPLQTVFARKLGAEAVTVSLAQLTLLRYQPAAVLVMTFVLALYPAGSGRVRPAALSS